MEDNKEKETGLGNQTPTAPVTNNTNPTPAQPKAPEVKPQPVPVKQPEPVDFGATGVDDINKNVGSFTNTVNSPAPATSELKLDVDSSVIEKASKEEIDFERFSKTKKEHKHGKQQIDSAPKTHFGERISMMLRTKKGLTTTWVLEIVIMILIIVAGACLIAWLTPYSKTNTIKAFGLYGVTKAGIVMFWISLFPCLIPLIYLLTTWFIGINQVASSRLYHVFFWITGAVSLLCFILGIGLCAPAMAKIAANPGITIVASLIL